ncbi:hypothetical protein BDA99DRAFT_544442 [Phascolomyces articulosus]|uniref:AMP-dependent synthetase/ligase domain-containing protein n=1 Tax=Phascolomyces articulosus TaxID=60185 RepID=A0AAD5JYT7_9FUNG|nr:hypothetical protein BDA99DRAFT_544442 [Phascolomyces articulosus]
MVQKIPKSYTDYTSIIQAFQIIAAENKDRPFVHYQQSNLREYKTLTYNEFDKITTYLANEWAPVLLPVVNANKQCVASLGHESSIQSLFMVFTMWKLGLIYFPISVWCSEMAITHLLKQSDPGYIIASESYFKTNLQSAPTLSVDSKSIPVTLWPEYDIDHLVTVTTASKNDTITGVIPPDLNSIAIIFVTGGSSTGIPKAIRYSNRAFLYALIDIVLRHEDQLNDGPLFMKPEDIWLVATPMERISTFYFFLWSMLLGASAILFHHDPPLTMQNFFEVGKMYKPTWVLLPPNLLEKVSEYLQDCSSDDISNTIQGVKMCITGGGLVRQCTAKFLISRGLQMSIAYVASGKIYFFSFLMIYLMLSQLVNDRIWRLTHKHTCSKTEFGSLCSPFENKPGNDGRYRFSDVPLPYLFFEPFDQGIYHLVVRSNYPGLATGVGNRPNGDYETGDLFTDINLNTNKVEECRTWTLIGRITDTFTLQNGKRVYPTLMELKISNEDIIHNCIIVGENKKCAAVLTGLAQNKAVKYSPTEMISKDTTLIFVVNILILAYNSSVCEAVRSANKRVPIHSAINVPSMVYILPLDKKLPLTDKGAVFRRGVNSDFAQEINQLYGTVNKEVAPTFSESSIKKTLKQMFSVFN